MQAYFSLSEMGKVSRNCTEDGWSEPFPHYVDVCFYDNTTKPVRTSFTSSKFPIIYTTHTHTHTHTTNPLSPTLGQVLRLSQGPVHSWLQHLAGVSDYSHGHSLQIQVSITMRPPKSGFSKLVCDMKMGFISMLVLLFLSAKTPKLQMEIKKKNNRSDKIHEYYLFCLFVLHYQYFFFYSTGASKV